MNEEQQHAIAAEQKAKALFNTAEDRGLIMPGRSEKELANEITELAKELYGTEQYWHKKIIRAGINTIQPFSGNPPDRIIQEDDLVIVDFGPVFNGWEADLGRTYVMGNDPLKLQLRNDTEAAWHEAKAWHDTQPDLTGARFFNYLAELAKRYGWEYAGELGGHLVGSFPHEQPDDPDDLCFDIHPDNHSSILLKDKNGNKRHWILEIHFVDRAKGIGAFFEQLIDQGD